MTPRPSALIRNRAAVTLFALALTICTATIAACTPPPAASAPPGPPSAATIASVFQSMHTPGRASFDSAVAKFPITPAKVNEIAESTREQTRFRGMIEDSPSLIIGNQYVFFRKQKIVHYHFSDGILVDGHTGVATPLYLSE